MGQPALNSELWCWQLSVIVLPLWQLLVPTVCWPDGALCTVVLQRHVLLLLLPRWEVEVTAPSSSYTSMVMGGRGHKLQPLFNLVFRRSSVQHPLLAGAMSKCGLLPVRSAKLQAHVVCGVNSTAATGL
jgi:hypothetical protein